MKVHSRGSGVMPVRGRGASQSPRGTLLCAPMPSCWGIWRVSRCLAARRRCTLRGCDKGEHERDGSSRCSNGNQRRQRDRAR